MGLVRIHPAAHTEKSRTVHGGCCITETSAVKGMVFAANSHGISHVPGRFAWLCSVLGRVEGSVTIHLPQTLTPNPSGSCSVPRQDSRAQWWYLLAKCSIRECVSACGSIGEEAGLQEMHTGQQGSGEADLTWLRRARDRLEREAEISVPSRTRCHITLRASAPPALPQEPCMS